MSLKPGEDIRNPANDKEVVHILKLREAVDEIFSAWYPDELTNLKRRLQDTN